MSIQLTQSAADHVKTMLEQQQDNAIGLRLSTKKAGCTGFSYVVDYAQKIGEEDQVFESRGVKLVVNKDDLVLLDGMEVDFVTSNALNKGFEFRNPNVKELCGCGESFNV